MPRAPRRAQHHGDDPTATPTRPEGNQITAAIPPFMLDTPPHAPFTTAPSYNPGPSIVPSQNGRAARAEETPADRPDGSQASTHALSTASEQHENAEQSMLESIQQEAEDAKALIGLRDISSLATWTLSSAKPGCALAQLRNSNTNLFWQSDGPQPHTLTLHFFKLVAIVKMRVYLDFDLDESYTPTKMKFFAGMSEGGLVEFGEWAVDEILDAETGEMRAHVENVKGWIDVELKGVGGREKRYFEVADEEDGRTDQENGGQAEDSRPGDVLKAMVVQVRVTENHQNGKDTHVRGFQVFSRDETITREVVKTKKQKKGKTAPIEDGAEVVGLKLADFMFEPVIR